jgi:hypothetical protein
MLPGPPHAVPPPRPLRSFRGPAAKEELDAGGDERVADVADVGDGAGEPVELGHDQSVPVGGQGPRPSRGGRGYTNLRQLTLASTGPSSSESQR